jgi:hypothetical protein
VITVKLQGGLGNQQFQFAMAFAQSRRLGVPLKLDVSLLEGDRRKYMLTEWSRHSEWQIGQRQKPTVNEAGMPFDQKLYDSIQDGAVINGYWQTEKYFLSVADHIRSIFHLPTDVHLIQNDWPNTIQTEPESVFVHVRRGDYMIEPHHSYHGTLPLSYYRNSMDFIRREVNKPRFFLFSDDPAWVLENFKDPDVTVVDVPRPGHAMYLMSLCRHAIIANSSFSWWGAWLGYGKKDGIHIAPRQWFANSTEDTRDIIPELWTSTDVIQPQAAKPTPEPGKRVLFAVNSWNEDAKRGCHQAIRETWGKDVGSADLRFFMPRLPNYNRLDDEIPVDVSREYNDVSKEVLAILKWSLDAGYDFTFLVSNDTFVKPQVILKSDFDNYDFCGFFHEQTPLGEISQSEYECTFDTADGFGVKRKLYNWADGGDGRMFSRKAAQAVVDHPEAAAYWFAADDICIGQVLGPLIATGDIQVWNIDDHREPATIPGNGLSWHYKNFPENKDVRYNPRAGWMHKMYEATR